jgi:hypothetical protein
MLVAKKQAIIAPACGREGLPPQGKSRVYYNSTLERKARRFGRLSWQLSRAYPLKELVRNLLLQIQPC